MQRVLKDGELDRSGVRKAYCIEDEVEKDLRETTPVSINALGERVCLVVKRERELLSLDESFNDVLDLIKEF